MDTDAIILAVASPPGRAARGVVRLSGAATFALLRQSLALDGDPPWTRGIYHATLRVLTSDLRCRVLLFPAPRSYTGAESAEIQLPGNPALLDRVVDALLATAARGAHPARRAEPGEYTARAFLSGRIDLAEAEGVAATIAARSDAELRAAQLLRRGKLATFARASADDLAAALALVEAGIDFTDEDDVVPIAPAELRAVLDGLAAAIAAQLERAVGTEELEAIPWVVLAGPTNAGKSTLFNALLGHERAVVSSAPGTTRDVIAHPLTVTTDHGPAEVMLADVAGDDPDPSTLNRLMQEARGDATARAELILLCAPAGAPAPPTADHRTIIVRTKAELGSAAHSSAHEIALSAVTGAGVDDLRALLAQRVGDRAVSLAADALVLRPRHEAALREAASNLREASAIAAPAPHGSALRDPELVAASMRTALDALGAVAGDVSPDDVLGRVFASFCIGK